MNKELILISGTTDSNASVIAAGLGKEDGLTVLGTTIVVKKIIDNPIKKQGITIHRVKGDWICGCLLYTSPSPRDCLLSRMPSSA